MKQYSKGYDICLAAAILGYICAVLTLISFNINRLLIATVITALSLLILKRQSRIASLLIIAVALYNLFILPDSNGQLTGWFELITGIIAVVGSFNCAKEWDAYQVRTLGIIPILK